MTELFEAIDDRDLYWFTELFDSVVLVDAAGADALIKRCLLSGNFRLVGLASQVLFNRKIKVSLESEDSRQIGQMLLKAPENYAFPIIDFLGSTHTSEVIAVLGGLLKDASWEKREKLIETLGSMKKVEAVVSLHSVLDGYSASSAAKVLGQLGDKSSIDPLKRALERAGPSAEMDILLALAQLGNTDIIPRLTEKLVDQNPEMRRMAVQIIGALGQPFVDKHLAMTKFDLDRFVRHDVAKFMDQ
ncbi:MAG: HEAT repeat domain-containing protein [Deltaproteobacteria bacterium]|nr:HEAT repeat domain-containing protein [Deltaproteobacteria bacterium]